MFHSIMTLLCLFQHLKCEDLRIFFVLHNCKPERLRVLARLRRHNKQFEIVCLEFKEILIDIPF